MAMHEKDRKNLIRYLTAAVGLLAAAAAGIWVCLRDLPREPLYVTVLSQIVPESQLTAADPAETAENRSAETPLTAAPAQTAVTTETAAPNRDLNTATEAELQRVSGIGEKLAAEIVRCRTERGGFRRRAELEQIPGIGEVLAARILEEFEIPDELPPETTAVTTATGAPVTAATDPQTETETGTTADETHLFFDINAVTEAELLRIPGMKPEMAEALLARRSALGAFESVYELYALPGFTADYVLNTAWEYLFAENDPVEKPRTWQTSVSEKSGSE